MSWVIKADQQKDEIEAAWKKLEEKANKLKEELHKERPAPKGNLMEEIAKNAPKRYGSTNE